MRMLLRALSAERLKLKRTLALWLVVVAPQVVILITIFVDVKTAESSAHVNVLKSISQGSLGLWAVFMLPLFAVLEAALISGIDHTAKGWKHLNALPVSRKSIYMAKLITVLILVSASSIVLWLEFVGTGLSLHLIRPAKFFIDGNIWLDTLKPLAVIYLAALLIIAFHVWASIRWPSFALSTGLGVLGVFFALFASGPEIGKYYPWLLPLNTRIPGRESTALVLGIVGGIVASVLGCWEVTRRDVL